MTEDKYWIDVKFKNGIKERISSGVTLNQLKTIIQKYETNPKVERIFYGKF